MESSDNNNEIRNCEDKQINPNDSSNKHLHCFLCKCFDPSYFVYSPNDDFYLCTNGPESLKGSHLLFVLEKYGSVPLQKVIYSKICSPIIHDDNDNGNDNNNNNGSNNDNCEDRNNENNIINNDEILQYSVNDPEKKQKNTYTLYKKKYLPIICHKCKNNNIFNLGFYKQEKKKKANNEDKESNNDKGNLEDFENIQQSFEKLICIQCLIEEFGSTSKIIRSFIPIFSLSTINDMIANRSTNKELIQSWLLSKDEFRDQIMLLRKRRNFHVKEIEQIQLKPLKLQYKNPGKYLNALLPFINEEENVSNMKTFSEKFYDIEIEIKVRDKLNKDDKIDIKKLSSASFYEFSFYAFHSIYTAMVPGSRVSIRDRSGLNEDNDDILGIVLSRDPKTSYVTITMTYGEIKFMPSSIIYERNIRITSDDNKSIQKTIFYFKGKVDIFRKPTEIPFARQRAAIGKFTKNNFFIKIMSGNLRSINKRTNGDVEPFVKEIDIEEEPKQETEEEDKKDDDDDDEDFDENDEAEGDDDDENSNTTKPEKKKDDDDDDENSNATKPEKKKDDDDDEIINNIFKGCNLEGNEDQFNAIKFALLHKFAMIQGPPGTGKSTCIAIQALAYFMKNESVLIITHSNTASDHIALILTKFASLLNYKVSDVVIRICGSTYEPIAEQDANLRPILLSNLVGGYKKENHSNQKKFIKDKTRIYIATAITSGGSRLDRKFERVIVDESNQLVDTELLVPLSHKCNQLTLYGDHKQIGPFVYSSRCKKNNFALSFIERLPKLGYKPICLETQYRMHPHISLFPSKAFYRGRLKNGVRAEDRSFEADPALLIKNDIPIAFYNVKNSYEQFSSSGKSFLNIAEASVLGEIISKFKNCAPKIQPEQLAIITFYNGMIDILRSHLHYLSSISKKTEDDTDDFCDRININTVDAFEGSDIDYVILVCVRSNKKKNIGFLSDMGRLNVALTRAKKALIIIGNARLLANDETWKKLIESLVDRKVLQDL